MLKQMTRRLCDRTVVTAAILALTGYNACAGGSDSLGGSHSNDGKTESPIKHVIVIMGENRTFDHIFATYVPPDGQRVDNLLSKKIINIDGSPGPKYGKAAQFSAEDTNFYSNHPGGKTAYNQTSNKLQAPGTSYAPLTCYMNVYDPRQPRASLLSDVATARLRRGQGAQKPRRMPGRPVPLGRDNGVVGQQWQAVPLAGARSSAQGRQYRNGLLQRRQGRRALFHQARPR